jgi:uncharacterized protein (DUF433 family)
MANAAFEPRPPVESRQLRFVPAEDAEPRMVQRADKTIEWRDFIVCDPEILCGRPTLKGTRLSVEFVLGLLAARWNRQELGEDYPNLTNDRIRAVLAYAAETFREDRFHLIPPAAEP